MRNRILWRSIVAGRGRIILFLCLVSMMVFAGAGCQIHTGSPTFVTDPFTAASPKVEPAQAASTKPVWGYFPVILSPTPPPAASTEKVTKGTVTEESRTYDDTPIQVSTAPTYPKMPKKSFWVLSLKTTETTAETTTPETSEAIARSPETTSAPASAWVPGPTAAVVPTTYAPTAVATAAPTAVPTAAVATAAPTAVPTAIPTPTPNPTPTPKPTPSPTPVPTTVATTTAAATTASSTESYWIDQLLLLTNEARAAEGLAPVSKGSAASLSAARIRAEESVIKFSHTRPDGRSCFTALTDAGVAFVLAGENLAAGFSSPSSMFTAWMNSPGHRANIMNAGYTHLAVGYQRVDGSAYTHYGVQLFYKP